MSLCFVSVGVPSDVADHTMQIHVMSAARYTTAATTNMTRKLSRSKVGAMAVSVPFEDNPERNCTSSANNRNSFVESNWSHHDGIPLTLTFVARTMAK